jgi:peptidoglycan/LPS O-acetylase OafA/YrhL
LRSSAQASRFGAVPPADSSTRPGGRHRFGFVDGLRGIAALAVAAHHIIRPRLLPSWPSAAGVTAYGRLGVLVFFVISGFVISHSIDGVWMTARAGGRFLLRRMARLDPPYWASIVLALVVAKAASLALHGGEVVVMPSAAALAAHLVYLQYILGFESVADIFWTLTFEIQFYLLLTTVTAIEQRLARRLPPAVASGCAHLPLLSCSVLIAVGVLPFHSAWCFSYWYAFAAGIGTQRLVAGRGAAPLAIGLGAALVVAWAQQSADGVVVALTATAIAVGHLRGRLDAWLSSPPFRYLGRISYSFYLVHPSLGVRAGNLAAHALPAGDAANLLGAAVGMLVSIVAADLFWRLIERPSIRLSRWITERHAAAALRVDGATSP